MKKFKHIHSIITLVLTTLSLCAAADNTKLFVERATIASQRAKALQHHHPFESPCILPLSGQGFVNAASAIIPGNKVSAKLSLEEELRDLQQAEKLKCYGYQTTIKDLQNETRVLTDMLKEIS